MSDDNRVWKAETTELLVEIISKAVSPKVPLLLRGLTKPVVPRIKSSIQYIIQFLREFILKAQTNIPVQYYYTILNNKKSGVQPKGFDIVRILFTFSRLKKFQFVFS